MRGVKTVSKKKIFILIGIVLVLLLGALIAINLKSKDNDLLSALEVDNSPNKDLKEAKLTFYFPSTEPKGTREVLDAVERKAKNKVNVKLDFKFIGENYYGNYLNKLHEALAAGQPCDAFYFSNDSISLTILANANLIKDITTLFPQNAPNYYNKFSTEEIASASVDNKIYAIPNRLPTTQMRCAIVRQDLMEKYNIPDIKNYDDYEFFLKTIKENEKDMTPLIFNDTAIGLFAEANGYAVIDYRLGLIYKWDDPNMKIMAWEQTPEFINGIEKINSWYTKDYLSKGISFIPISESIISSGKFASIISYLGSDFEYNNILQKNKVSWRYKAYLLYSDKYSARLPLTNNSMVINAKSENAERALMFIDWLQMDQENYDSLMYGIEGKHYTLVEDYIKLPDGKQTESWGWRWPFRNIEFERGDSADSNKLVKEYYKTITEKTKLPPHTGFELYHGNSIDAVNNRSRLFGSIEHDILTGNYKQGSIDSYLKQQKSYGTDKLVADVQQQIDTWKAGK